MSLRLTVPVPEKSAVVQQSSEGRNPAHPRNRRGSNFEGTSRLKLLESEWLSSTPAAHYDPLAIPSRQLCSIQCFSSAMRAALHFSRVPSAYFLASSNWPCCPTRPDKLSVASKFSIAVLA